MANTKEQTPVERAKARMEQWQAQYEESARTPSYLHLTPTELIAMAAYLFALCAVVCPLSMLAMMLMMRRKKDK